jgi:uncharacterized protein
MMSPRQIWLGGSTTLNAVDSSNPTESREAAIGYTEGERLLFVHVIRHEEETIRIISAREATREERRQYEKPVS